MTEFRTSLLFQFNLVCTEMALSWATARKQKLRHNRRFRAHAWSAGLLLHSVVHQRRWLKMTNISNPDPKLSADPPPPSLRRLRLHRWATVRWQGVLMLVALLGNELPFDSVLEANAQSHWGVACPPVI